MLFYTSFIEELRSNEVFVFGSNPEGRHGLGAAKLAVSKYGAKYGVGRGHQGQTYALPTKNLTKGYTEKATGITYGMTGPRSLTKDQIRNNIEELYKYAESRPDLLFYIAYMRDTKSLNGYTGYELKEMFTRNITIPKNIVFHISFL